MIESIKLVNFRSHKELSIDFSPNTTAIIGSNAAGKTNILEALYYAFITKSFRSAQSSLIKRDMDFMKLNINYQHEKPSNLEYRLKQSKGFVSRTITINGVKKRASDVIGIQPIVIFVPDDVRIITDGPQFRRNLINNIIIQTSREYLTAISRFQKILTQRNKLLYNLKHNRNNSKDQLFVYNLQLVNPISTIYSHRDELVAFLNKNLGQKYSSISGNSDKITIEQLNTLPKDKDHILAALEARLGDDMAAGFTSKGPHKDELAISLNGFSTRDNLSRGENRSLSLAIKLCELDFIHLKKETPPLLLLDDVLSELDEQRQSHLIEQAANQQTIITSTSISDSINDYEIVKI